MPLSFERIATERLTLEPLSRTVAGAIVQGDLAQVKAGKGWPHEDTRDGLAMRQAQRLARHDELRDGEFRPVCELCQPVHQFESLGAQTP